MTSSKPSNGGDELARARLKYARRMEAKRTGKSRAALAVERRRFGGFGRPKPGQVQEPANVVLKRARYRILLAVIVLPWVFVYALVGVWAVFKALSGLARGGAGIEVGYGDPRSPVIVLFVGVLVVCSCVVVGIIVVRMLRDARGRTMWQRASLVAFVIAAGASAAGAAVGMSAYYWLPFVGGVAYAAVLALVWRTRPAHVKMPVPTP